MSFEPLTIRSYGASDQAEVVQLWQTVFPDDPSRNAPLRMIERKLRVQRQLFLVGLRCGEIIATVLGGYDGVRGWVYHLAVHPSARRRAYGAQMMSAVEVKLAELGCPKINLQVRATNTGVIAFYESLGYHVEERVSMGKVIEPQA